MRMSKSQHAITKTCIFILYSAENSTVITYNMHVKQKGAALRCA